MATKKLVSVVGRIYKSSLMVAVNLKSWAVVQGRHVDTYSCINRCYVIVWPIINYNDSLWSLFTSENYYSCNTMTYKVIKHFLGRQRTSRLPHVMVLAAMTRWYEFFFWEGGGVIPTNVYGYLARVWSAIGSTHGQKIMLKIHVTKHWHIMHYFEINRATKATNYTGKII